MKFFASIFLLFIVSVVTHATDIPFNGEMFCPAGQHMIGLHEKCFTMTGGCAVDYLHCA
jgi:hypothetical protein